ncbi:pimeloyl-ACP methyl ester carboxylesterase [Acinetobacter calcoaceticus]|uniref:Pimeloyl-ACP methyl ester carboxylesterase n=1 Tax=Acinetobacter calcoaceticus TaxID=471 RepID=A0A4R1Y308_ACICA|nr:pimeloyl-ACP methyl ester carboxylesterase [Acinetobacter calcoaceticus]
MNSIPHMEPQLYSRNSIDDFFDLYNKNSFKQPARVSWIDGWKVEYMAIADPETRFNIPTLIVGGAFQNFNSYKYCVEQLFEKGPVILIDMPSLGANQQIFNRDTGDSAAQLELPDLSRMLGEWLDLVKIPLVSVMGLSLGSVVASCFAQQRPELVERMILMGVMQETRKSWRMLLEESLLLMKEQRMHEFGQAVILYLVNHAKLDKTRMSPTARRLFYKQMSAFGGTEQQRYEINCNRLLRLSHVPAPECRTLIACGEYDSFTLPFENAHFALQCPDMQFAMIANADHLPQLQRRKETMNLFTQFLKDQAIDQIEGVKLLTRDQIAQIPRRGEARIKVDQPNTVLGNERIEFPVEIIDLNYFGVLLHCEDLESAQWAQLHPRDLALYLHDDQGEFKIECLIFETSQLKLRALFKHGSFEISERLRHYIAAQVPTALDPS